jgi:hypothetical protein
MPQVGVAADPAARAAEAAQPAVKAAPKVAVAGAAKPLAEDFLGAAPKTEKPATRSITKSRKAEPTVLAEAPGEAPAPDLHADDPYAHGAGPVVGTEADPIERVDNAMYRLGGHATADKAEMAEYLKSLPAEITQPETQERLYNAIEQRLVHPDAPIPADLQPAYVAMQKLRDEQTELANRLRERNDPDLEPYLADSGYVPRRVQGYTPMLDEGLTPGTRDPILGKGRSLTSRTTAQKQRTAGFVATDADGQAHFYSGEVPKTDILDRPYASVRQATSGEIEAETGVRYHKNALINTVDNVLRLRQVSRNLDVLDELKGQLKADGLAFQKEWHYPNEQGQMVRGQAKGQPPDGFVELRQFPQLNGWYFDKRVGEVMRDYRPDPNNPNALIDGLNKLNRAMTASLFATPIPHAANVMAHWTVGRGWDWMTAPGYARLMRTGTQAAREVLTMGPKYRQMLREGSALLYGDTQTRNFQKLLMDKAGREFFEDPKAISAFARAAGVPVEAVKGWYRLMNQSLWAAGDIFMLQRQLELEAKGMSTRKAIHEAERDIPNYRIPPQVLGSRMLAETMKNPSLMMFGRYKYGQIRAWGTMVKDLAGKGEGGMGGAAQKDAVGKALVALIAANVAYPMLDAVAQQATGNKHARVKRAGGFSLTDSAYKMLGPEQKDLADIMSSFVSVAPAIQGGMEAATNRDHFGRTIRTPGAGPDLQAAEEGMHVAGSVAYPVQLGTEAAKGNPAGALGKLAGLELPTDKQVADREKYRARDKRAGAKATRRFRQRLQSGDIGGALTKLGKKQ